MMATSPRSGQNMSAHKSLAFFRSHRVPKPEARVTSDAERRPGKLTQESHASRARARAPPRPITTDESPRATQPLRAIEGGPYSLEGTPNGARQKCHDIARHPSPERCSNACSTEEMAGSLREDSGLCGRSPRNASTVPVKLVDTRSVGASTVDTTDELTMLGRRSERIPCPAGILIQDDTPSSGASQAPSAT